MGGAAASLRAATMLVLTMLAANGSAQPLEPETASQGRERAHVSFGGRIGGARLGDDAYLYVTPSALLTLPRLTLAEESPLFDTPQRPTLRIAAEVPLFFRVKDNPPTDQSTALRRQLWDDPAEKMRVVRWAELGRPYDGVYARVGELPDVRIGHRTIVDAYDNAIDAERFQWGVQASLNTVYGGVEAIVDDVTNPDVVGGRVYVRPLSFGSDVAAGRRFAVGASLVVDEAAPTRLATSDDGAGYRRSDSGGMIVTSSELASIVGFDAEYVAAQSRVVTLTPYTDANVHLARGAGWHAGAFAGFKPFGPLVIDLRAEYRLAGAGYLPAYVGRLYEVERLTYLPVEGSPLHQPKVVYADSLHGVRHGYAAEVGANVASKLFLTGGWEGTTARSDTAAWAQVRLPPIGRFQAGASYVNSRFHGARGLVDLTHALAVAELRVTTLPWLFVDGAYRRRWEVDTRGRYLPVSDWWIGAGVAFGNQP